MDRRAVSDMFRPAFRGFGKIRYSSASLGKVFEIDTCREGRKRITETDAEVDRDRVLWMPCGRDVEIEVGFEDIPVLSLAYMASKTMGLSVSEEDLARAARCLSEAFGRHRHSAATRAVAVLLMVSGEDPKTIASAVSDALSRKPFRNIVGSSIDLGYARYMAKVCGFRVRGSSIDEVVESYIRESGVPETVASKAIEIYRSLVSKRKDGLSPRTLAALSIYMAGVALGGRYRMSRDTVAEIMGVSPPSISSALKRVAGDLASVYRALA